MPLPAHFDKASRISTRVVVRKIEMREEKNGEFCGKMFKPCLNHV
jgi:hypothetical protein